MNILYQTPIGQVNPHLFPVLEREFAKMGITSTNDPNEATHCFLNILSGVCKYDTHTLNIVEERKIPIINFDCREYGDMSGYIWDDIWLNPDITFVRNFNSNNNYPSKCHPFDWPYFQGCDYPPTTKDELFNREFDVALFSVEAPIRKSMIDAIIKDGRLKVNHKFLDHTQRLPYEQWVNEHRKAKLFISADGGGYTNERPNQLFSVAAMLKNKTQHIPAASFSDLVNCIEINPEPTKEDIDKIIDVIENKDWLYDVYMEGIKHMKKYCSPEAVASRVLKIIYGSRP